MAPLLSIGLPIYNGSRHLREAIDSLLDQDVGDLELVISDNASTDDTAAICAEYANKDSRVLYTRNDTNIGAAANFNRAFELCSGTYFMWGSDDDVWEATFASRCIEILNRSPNAVACTSEMILITADGSPSCERSWNTIATPDMSIEARVHQLIKRNGWYSIYSVIRPSALRATGGFSPDFGGDVHLLLELLLQGDLLVDPEPLFRYRLPARLKTSIEYAVEISATAVSEADAQVTHPWCFLARKLLDRVRHSSLDERTIHRIEADFSQTLSGENAEWGQMMVAERGLSTVGSLPTWAIASGVRSTLESSSPFAPLVSQPQPPQSWRPTHGMRLRSLRQAMLRLLQPFGDKQDMLDARQSALIDLLATANEDLRRRIERLEAHADRATDNTHR
jgi:glycosyltransferase involved in cell wall biosynthesis